MSMDCIYNAYIAIICCFVLLGVYFISNTPLACYVVVAGVLSVLVWFVWSSKKQEEGEVR